MVGGEQSFGDGGYGDTPLAEVLPVEPLAGLAGGGGRGPRAPHRRGAAPPHHRAGAAARGRATRSGGRCRRSTAVNLTRALGPGQGAAVLLEAPAVQAEGRPAPLVAVRQVGQGRTLAVTTDASWRWGFLAAEAGRRRPDLHALLELGAPLAGEGPGADAAAGRAGRADRRAGRRRSASPSPPTAPTSARPSGKVSVELVAEDGKRVAHGEAVAGADGTARVELRPPGPGAYKVVSRGGGGAGGGDHRGGGARRRPGGRRRGAPPRAAPLPRRGDRRRLLQRPRRRPAAPGRSTTPRWSRSDAGGPCRSGTAGGPWPCLAALLAAEWVLRRRWGYW